MPSNSGDSGQRHLGPLSQGIFHKYLMILQQNDNQMFVLAVFIDWNANIAIRKSAITQSLDYRHGIFLKVGGPSYDLATVTQCWHTWQIISLITQIITIITTERKNPPTSIVVPDWQDNALLTLTLALTEHCSLLCHSHSPSVASKADTTRDQPGSH